MNSSHEWADRRHGGVAKLLKVRKIFARCLRDPLFKGAAVG